MSKQKFNPKVIQQLSMRLDTSDRDQDTRTVKAALSSELVVKRWFGNEKLIHKKDAINLERAKDNGLPLLFSHDPTKPIGRVRNVHLGSDNKLRGDIQFSKNKHADEIYSDVLDGMLSDISIGYTIDEYVEKNDGIEATRWTPKEASIVAIPADHKVGVGRSAETDDSILINEVTTMSDEDKKVIADRAVEDYKNQQATRKADIENIFETSTFKGGEYDALKARALADEKMNADQVRDELLQLVGKNTSSHSGPSVRFGEDSADKFDRAVEETLSVRLGNCRDDKVKSNIRSNEFFGYTMVDIARRCLEINGMIKPGLSRMDILGEALTMRAIHGVADFPNILANTANGSMQLAYEEAPETWRTWARVGNLSDFKVTDRPALSAFDDLPVVADKANYTEGAFSDLKETIQLATYGKLFRISRQALINDNLDGLGRIPAAMGRAAARTVGTLAYNVLTANAAMNQDSVAVFHAASHSNDTDDGGAGPTNAFIQAGYTAMQLQQDPSTNGTLGIIPAYLIVPTSYRAAAMAVMEAEFAPGTTPGNLQPNTERGLMQVVVEHRLEGVSPKPWFMAAATSQSETVEVAFLDGQDSPTLEQDDPFTHDGVDYKVRIDAAAQVLEYRGLQRFSNLP